MELSIVIPIYNVERTLQRCIDSVLGQSFQDFEMILVDDGSKDNSSVMADEIAQSDSRISVIHQSNQGLSAARNTGIKVAKGKYITFIYFVPCISMAISLSFQPILLFVLINTIV